MKPPGLMGPNAKLRRLVPVADRMLPLVRAMAIGREADARLFVTSEGHRLHASTFKRTLGLGQGGRGSAHP
jgi:hypothetical protein